MNKVPRAAAFLDLSDYARPLARPLVRILAPTPVRAWQITLLYTLIGGLAAAWIASGDPLLRRAGALLLPVKSWLDAVDGSLARAQHRPSRVGRFLDSLADFVLNILLMAAIGKDTPLLAVTAWLSMTLQGTLFHRGYVLYRHAVGGDRTARLRETADDRYPWDPPGLLRILQRLYALCYGWQDRLMETLDRRFCPENPPPSPRWMTLVSVHGLGFQLLWMVPFVWVGADRVLLWSFIGWNLWALGLLLLRCRCRLQQEDRT